jgi:hypothetical protein
MSAFRIVCGSCCDGCGDGGSGGGWLRDLNVGGLRRRYRVDFCFVMVVVVVVMVMMMVMIAFVEVKIGEFYVFGIGVARRGIGGSLYESVDLAFIKRY